MKTIISLLSLIAAFSVQAGPTNSILFVTQVPIPGDFTSIGSTFGNHRALPAGSNIVLTAQAIEISRIGSPNESVTIRDLFGIHDHAARFLRINVTRP